MQSISLIANAQSSINLQQELISLFTNVHYQLLDAIDMKNQSHWLPMQSYRQKRWTTIRCNPQQEPISPPKQSHWEGFRVRQTSIMRIMLSPSYGFRQNAIHIKKTELTKRKCSHLLMAAPALSTGMSDAPAPERGSGYEWCNRCGIDVKWNGAVVAWHLEKKQDTYHVLIRWTLPFFTSKIAGL